MYVLAERRLATSAAESRTRTGPVQIGVTILALATAGVHLYLFLIEGFLAPALGYEETMVPIYQFLFVANFLGYVTLVVALYLIPPLARFRPVVRVLLIALATASIISYFHVNVRDLLGDVNKLTELLLVMLLAVDAGMSGPKEEPVAGR